MNTNLQINFKAVRSAYAPIFEALERALALFEIDFYLIGAQARDVWISHLGVTNRLTTDIDYCVLVANKEIWLNLNNYLIETEKFVKDESAPHRFYWENYIVDILPFGGIQHGTEVQLDNPPIDVSVFGCLEVSEDAEDADGVFKVVTLPGLCILKIVANSENTARIKDWDDFVLIAGTYSEIAGDQLFMGKYEDLLDEDFDLKIAGARILGRHMNDTLSRNETLKVTVVSFLAKKLGGFSDVEIDQMYLYRERDNKQVETLKLTSEVLKGIKD